MTKLRLLFFGLDEFDKFLQEYRKWIFGVGVTLLIACIAMTPFVRKGCPDLVQFQDCRGDDFNVLESRVLKYKLFKDAGSGRSFTYEGKIS